jgi:hypothetical protein
VHLHDLIQITKERDEIFFESFIKEATDLATHELGTLQPDEQHSLGKIISSAIIVTFPQPELKYTPYWTGFLTAYAPNPSAPSSALNSSMIILKAAAGNNQKAIAALKHYRQWIFFHIGEFDAGDQELLGKLDLRFSLRLSANILQPSPIHADYWKGRGMPVTPKNCFNCNQPCRHDLCDSCKTDEMNKYPVVQNPAYKPDWC